jgi:hypothetical protein
MKRLIPLLIAFLLLPVVQAQSGKLSLQNDTGKNIKAVHISPIDVDRFGPNLLRGKALPQGAAFNFPDLPNGLYDMRIVDGDGAECILKDVDYFQYTVWTVTRNCGAFGGTGG